MPASTPAITVRETVCKTVLNRSVLGGYSLNCYTGCTHACAYCYARFMQRFHPHAERWGEFVDVKVNAVETLKRQLRRLEPGDVFVSSACDGWQPIEAQWRLTRRCCELLLEHGFQLNVLTKSSLVARDFDIFRDRSVRVGITLTSLDESLRRHWEPRASSVRARIDVLNAARREGLRTSVMFGPLLPGLSDQQSDLDAMFRQADGWGVEAIWVDALNPRPRVWLAVAELLRAEFPDLLPLYRKMLFDKKFREEYLASLQQRIDLAARRARVSDRLAGCVE
ncbi:MAG: radical SAM protein [Thermoguttaceae bacterium]